MTSCNRQNLNHFEMQSRKSTPGGSGAGPQHVGGQGNFGQRNAFSGQASSGGMRPPLIQRPVRPNGPLLAGQPRMAMPHQGIPFQGQPQWAPVMPPSAPPRPPAPLHPGAPPIPNMPLIRMPPQTNRGPVPQQPLLRGPSTQNDPRTQIPVGPMQEWANDHQQHGHGPPGPQNPLGLPQPGQQQTNVSIPPRPGNEFSGSQNDQNVKCLFIYVFDQVQFLECPPCQVRIQGLHHMLIQHFSRPNITRGLDPTNKLILMEIASHLVPYNMVMSIVQWEDWMVPCLPN